MPTVDQENEIEREKRKSVLRDQARVFRELFSTPLGKTVLETLHAKFATATGIPANMLDNEGRTDPLQTWRKLGHHDVMQFVRIQMEYKEADK